jgi:hypothetical protein
VCEGKGQGGGVSHLIMKINCGKGLDSCAFQLCRDENVVTESFVGKELHLARDVLPFVDCERLIQQQTTL